MKEPNRYAEDGSILAFMARLQPRGRPPVWEPSEAWLEGARVRYRSRATGLVRSMLASDWDQLEEAGPAAKGRPATVWPRVDSDPSEWRISPNGPSVASHRQPPRRTDKDPDWLMREDVVQCYTWWDESGAPQPGAVPWRAWRLFSPPPPDWTPPEERW
jgi:hypothetical protein